jgi:hypothetical protein
MSGIFEGYRYKSLVVVVRRRAVRRGHSSCIKADKKSKRGEIT